MKLRFLTAVSVGLLTAGAAFADTTSATTTTQPVIAQPAIPAATAKSTVTSLNNTASATTASNNSAVLISDKDKVSYSIGVDLGNGFKMQSIDINQNILMRGIQDGLSGGNTLMTKQQMIATLTNFQKQIFAKKQMELNALNAKNQQESDAFLAANKVRPGVTVTASGLQYKVVQQGQGASPTDNDIVTVDYTGRDIHGKVFDSSAQHGKSVTFPLTEVIPGWTEALKLMKPGATYEIYLPPTLAYGTRGFGPIGPSQALQFTIHLVAVKPSQTATANALSVTKPAA